MELGPWFFEEGATCDAKMWSCLGVYRFDVGGGLCRWFGLCCGERVEWVFLGVVSSLSVSRLGWRPRIGSGGYEDGYDNDNTAG